MVNILHPLSPATDASAREGAAAEAAAQAEREADQRALEAQQAAADGAFFRCSARHRLTRTPFCVQPKLAR
jgi:hypothetical protein